MKTKLIFLIITTTLSSCQNNKKIDKQKNVAYYDTGEILGQGFLNDDSLKIGKWDYFKKDGSIDKTFEYLIINGKQYTNQNWTYGKSKNDTLKDISHYFKIQGFKEYNNINDTIHINIEYKPLLALNSQLILCTSNNINKDFDNINVVELDTVYGKNMKIDFVFIPQKKGKNTFRGFLKEFYHIEPTKEDDIDYKERVVYFDKEYFVTN